MGASFHSGDHRHAYVSDILSNLNTFIRARTAGRAPSSQNREQRAGRPLNRNGVRPSVLSVRAVRAVRARFLLSGLCRRDHRISGGFSPPFGRWGGWATRETWLPPLRWPQIQAGTPDFGGPTSPPGRTGPDTPRTRHGHGSDKPGAATDTTDTTDSPDSPAGLRQRLLRARESDPAPPRRIPTGFRNKAQGCEQRATLGKRREIMTTLKGLRPHAMARRCIPARTPPAPTSNEK